MRRRERLAMASLSLVLPGCYPAAQATLPPYQMNRPATIKAGDAAPDVARPILTVVEPPGGAAFAPKAKIHCVIRVEVPDGGRMPEVVNVALKRGAVQSAGGFPATPVTKTERSASLEIDLIAPSSGGAHEIEAEAISTTITEPKSPGEPPSTKTERTYSPRIRIQIR